MRYRPQPRKAKKRTAAELLRAFESATVLSVSLTVPLPAECTDNYRALDRLPMPGSRTPLQWPPIVWNRVVA